MKTRPSCKLSVLGFCLGSTLFVLSRSQSHAAINLTSVMTSFLKKKSSLNNQQMVLTIISLRITAVRDFKSSDIKVCIILHQGTSASRDSVKRLPAITPTG